MCWELLSLKDSASQELLAAVKQERNFRLSRSPNSPMFSRNSLDEIEFHHVPSYIDDSAFEERLMQHLAAAAMEPEPQSGNSPSFTVVDSNTPVMTPTREEQLQHGPSSSPPGPMSSRTGRNANVGFQGFDSRVETFPPRYKESISRSTRGFREKLFARNSPLAELRREVSIGIAGVARTMKRLDPIGKNNGTTATRSSNMEEILAGMPIRHDVKEHQGSIFSDVIGSSSCGTSSDLSTANPQIVSDKSDNCMGGTSVKVKNPDFVD